MHQIRFRWGSAPDPARGAYSAPPDPLARLWGLLKGRRGRMEGEWEGWKERKGGGRDEREGSENILA